MAIYDINYETIVSQLLPPSRRLTKFIAWLTALTSSTQRSRDDFFIRYADGDTTSPGFVLATAYNFGDKVRYNDRAIYQMITYPSLGAAPLPPPQDPTNWVKIQDVWVGVRERIKYDSQKLLLEYILNNWFITVFRQPTAFVAAPVYYTPKSDIYIDNTPLTNNVFRVGINEAMSSFVTQTEVGAIDYVGNNYSFSSSCFTIFIPVAIWTALGADTATRDGAIRSVVDKYVLAGITYIITPY